MDDKSRSFQLPWGPTSAKSFECVRALYGSSGPQTVSWSNKVFICFLEKHFLKVLGNRGEDGKLSGGME